MDDPAPCYKRILLKLSGEALKGDQPYGIDSSVIDNIAEEIVRLHNFGVEIAIVTGGGNFFRGIESGKLGIERVSADYMGMLATVMNGIALRDVLEKRGLDVRVISGLNMPQVAELFVNRRARRHMASGRVVIFSAGTGNPYFTTDTAAALRAIEIKADVFLKATMVDGVYSDDPRKVKDIIRYDHLTYDEVITKELKVMDATAVTLCKDNRLLIKIFDITKKGNIVKAITDRSLGTSIDF